MGTKMKTGELVVTRRSEYGLGGFTAYKVYKVISGEGEKNQSPAAIRLGTMLTHSERTFNVVDDNGNIRFVTDQYFKPFNSELGLFK